MGRPSLPETGFRDDPDAVSLHTAPGESYTDDVDDVPDLGGDTTAPPAYSEVEEEPVPVHQDVNVHTYFNGVSPAETHIEGTSYRIGEKRARITNEVIPLQDARSDGDPAFLESWVKFMASLPPSPYIHIKGTHQETRRDKDGKSKREEVTDFRILVSLQNYLWPNFDPHGPNEMSLKTIESGEKRFRGTVFKQKAPGVKGEIEVGHTKADLTEWCHRYCAKSAGNKIFRLTRIVTGLDRAHLRDRLEGLIRGTNYRGKLSIEFPVADRAVDIYSSSRLNSWRLTRWICWAFYLTFLWIFSWPILFFSTKKYHVVRAEWPFSQVNAQGQKRYTTVSEEQWASRYGPAIKQLCLDRYQGLAGDTFLNEVLARGETHQDNDDQIDARAAMGVAAAAFSGGRFNTVNAASGLMRFVGGSNDPVGWGFDS